MRLKLICLSGLVFSACASLPIDSTPDWASNNRYAVEQKVDCNTVKLGIGLSGCAFYENQIGGNLTLPSLWNGMLTFTSYNCNSFTQIATSNADNIIPIRTMYTALNKDNCSFQINRTVNDSGITADFPMIGRFMIKIIPAKQSYKMLNFKVNNDSFSGVGWFQRLYGKADAQLVINAMDSKGTFVMYCGTHEVVRLNYTSNSFVVPLESTESCDYEMAAYSATLPYQEFGTYMHEVSQYTNNISVPEVLIKNSKITFQFNDKDSSGKKPVVFAVQIENTKRIKTNKFTVINNKSRYIVKAVTPSLRLFYGIYANNIWEVK